MVSYVYSDLNVIFFDPNDQPVAMLDRQIVPFNMKSLKHDPKTKVIFDQKHTIGTDLDLHSTSRGILTVNNMTTSSALVQGAFRFREADLNQKITYLTKDVKQTIDVLVQNVNDRENRMFAKSEIKFYQQTILCLLRRYDKYSKESYQYRSFVPSEEMSDTIFDAGSYNHDYKKEAFNTYVDNCLASVDRYIESLASNIGTEFASVKRLYQSDPQREAIKKDILACLEIINSSDTDDNSVMVQKQSDIKKEKIYQSEMETNMNRQRFPYFEVTFDKIVVYNVDLIPTSISTTVKFGSHLDKDPMIKYMKDLNIYMSPDAAYSISKIYNTGESGDLVFFMAFIRSESSDDFKVMLYTSVDMIILFSQNRDLLPNLITLNEFMTDGSRESFFQNFMMFLILKIPNTDTINYLESQESIQRIVPMISDHYKKVFKYNIRPISERFADFIEPR